MDNITVNEIVNEIEFAIAQGYIAHEEFQQAIIAARKFQHAFRFDVFSKLKLSETFRKIVSKQFQMNEMLLSLLYEMGLSIQVLQNENRRLSGLERVQKGDQELHPANEILSNVRGNWRLDIESPGDDSFQAQVTDDLINIMKPEAIHVDLQVKTNQNSLLGRILAKLKIFYHRPALFYTQILSNRQANINRILGDRVLTLETMIRQQQKQIEILKETISKQVQEVNTPNSNPDIP
jgi:hypothetical protein